MDKELGEKRARDDRIRDVSEEDEGMNGGDDLRIRHTQTEHRDKHKHIHTTYTQMCREHIQTHTHADTVESNKGSFKQTVSSRSLFSSDNPGHGRRATAAKETFKCCCGSMIENA